MYFFEHLQETSAFFFRVECQVVLFDCDDFTQKFYKQYLGTDQRANRLDVSDKPVTHLKCFGPDFSTLTYFLH